MLELFGKIIPDWWYSYVHSAPTFLFSTGVAIYVIGGILWMNGRIGK